MLTASFNDVKQTLEQFRRSVDQMFENMYAYPGQPVVPATAEKAYTFTPVLESGWNDHFLILRAILPGVPEKEITVTVQNNQLILEGERKLPEKFVKNVSRHLLYGPFYAAITLPTGLDVDHIVCKLLNGVLEIEVPIAETSKPKHIEIVPGEMRKSIGA